MTTPDSKPLKPAAIAKQYEEIFKQILTWELNQSWTKKNFIVTVEALLDQVCAEKKEPAGCKYDEAVKEIRKVRTKVSDKEECFAYVHGIIRRALTK